MGLAVAIGFWVYDGRLNSLDRATTTLERATIAINVERERNVLFNCRDVNQRHDNAVAKLNHRLDVLSEGLSREQLAQVRESRNFTHQLLKAVVPKRDCRDLAARQITSRNP